MSRLDLDALRRYRRVTVMGLGLFGGGAGVARFFALLGAAVTVTDMAAPEQLAGSVAALDGLGIRFVLGRHEPQDFTTPDLVIANQSVRPDNRFLALARAAGIPIATEIGLALALNTAPWVGVTGSSGKSTTAALIATILTHHDPATVLGGNIGGDLITRTSARVSNAPLVVELSSFQLTHIAAGLQQGEITPPQVAVLTNLAPNHLDWHSDMAEYTQAKYALVGYQQASSWVILPAEEALPSPWSQRVPGRVVHCSVVDAGHDDASFVAEGQIVVRLGGRVVWQQRLDKFRLPGRHNLHNAVQAVAAAYVLSRDTAAIACGLTEFAGLPHRLEFVGSVAGIRFINDSKATTPEAAVVALAAMDVPTVLIAGGYDKHAPFAAFAAAVQQYAHAVVLLGEAGPRIHVELLAAARARPEGKKPLVIVVAAHDFPHAVAVARDLAPPGGTVLLSPACASYGMFTNYEQRGDLFRQIIEEWKE